MADPIDWSRDSDAVVKEKATANLRNNMEKVTLADILTEYENALVEEMRAADVYERLVRKRLEIGDRARQVLDTDVDDMKALARAAKRK